jgi:hypothetical protein
MINSLPLVARLFGINKYRNYPDLQTAADINVDTLEKFLKEQYKGDIKTFKDEEATRDKIVGELTALRETFDRNSAILVFFSGIAGKTESGSFILCPSDMGESTPGITEENLTQLFNNIARARGNNIVRGSSLSTSKEAGIFTHQTFLLDNPSPPFKWGNLSSFVVVESSCLNDRAAFTNSIINVLRKVPIKSLTVQSFVDQIRAVVYDP